MVHQYTITGMTCGSCEEKVKNNLLSIPFITDVEVSKETSSGTITMERHIDLFDLQNALGGSDSKYTISEVKQNIFTSESKTWLETYKPIVLIFIYITVVAALSQVRNEEFDFMLWMRHFMAGFFLVFSFFKLLNLKGFTESYAMYDIIAKKIPVWGYFYALFELGLGIAYLVDFNPILVNSATAIIMSISIVGVLQSVLNKKKIQCACLGSVFNLPMSTVTIIEDGLMIIMSLVMLYFSL